MVVPISWISDWRISDIPYVFYAICSGFLKELFRTEQRMAVSSVVMSAVP